MTDTISKATCYRVGAASIFASWVFVFGIFQGWDIPPLLAGDWPWWGYLILCIVGIPIGAAVAFFFFIWLGVMGDFLEYLTQDKWKIANALSPTKSEIIYKVLTACQFALFLPFVLAFFAWAGRSE